MAARAAVIRRADVSSKVQTYGPKIRSARPLTLPPALASSRPTGAGSRDWPMTAISSAPRPRPSSTPQTRIPLWVSTVESAESTPIIIRTNRKSIITAPV